MLAGLQNLIAVFVIVSACALVLGGIWAVTDTVIRYGACRVYRKPKPLPPHVVHRRVTSFRDPAAQGWEARRRQELDALLGEDKSA